MTLGEALRQGAELLATAEVPSPRLNAEVLLMHACRCARAHLFAHSGRALTDVEWVHYGRYLKERIDGKPTQYITGHQEFWGLDFLVNPSVLIPRPETELLVEVALELTRARFSERPCCTIADVGTGSGCIAIALATVMQSARFIALDQSEGSLQTARKNAERLRVHSRISFLQSDLLVPCSGEPLRDVDVVVSNPPYVSTADRANMQAEVRDHEPAAAVFAGESGLEVYERLVPQAAALLAPGGLLVLELGYDVEEAVRKLLDGGKWDRMEWRKDLAGITRVVSCVRVPD